MFRVHIILLKYIIFVESIIYFRTGATYILYTYNNLKNSILKQFDLGPLLFFFFFF